VSLACSRTYRLALVALCSVVLWGAVAQAGPQYDQALQAYEKVEYPEAVRLLERALPSEALSPTELERAYFILGSSLLGDGQAEHAERVFRTLIALRPDYRAERDASPKVVEAVKRARAAIGDAPPRILPDAALGRGGDTVTVTAEMTAASVLTPALEYRVRGQTGVAVSRLRVRCELSRCEAKIPASAISYRLGFLTPEGAFALATSEQQVPARSSGGGDSRPVYKKWWLWTIVGVVVVGGITGTAVGVSLSQKAAHSIDFSIRKDCGGSAVCPLWSTP
jgi:hypothetical protein